MAFRRAKQAVARRIRQVAGARVADVPDVFNVEAPGMLQRLEAAREMPMSLAFSEVFREPSSILASLERYASLVAASANGREVLDLGSGRGDLLSLMIRSGLDAHGCEPDPVQFERLMHASLPVTEDDACTALESREPVSLGGITAIQLIEHLEPDYFVELMGLVGSRLSPGGVAVLETPNLLNDRAQSSFWLDLSHVRPYPPETIQFYLEWSGVSRIEYWYSQLAIPSHGAALDDRYNYENVTVVAWK